MEIHAYSQDYLDDAQSHLGEAFDYAIVTLEYDIKDFSDFFVHSDVSRQIENGNPAYVAGKNGCELARLILEQSGIINNKSDEIYLDKSPEYWVGWVLAFYQWYTCRTFEEILREVPAEEILRMYPVFHEMDLMQFVDAMEDRIQKQQTETRLTWRRKNSGLSQAELADISKIPVQTIINLEKSKDAINHSQAIELYSLSRALNCKVEDLIERPIMI